MSGGRCGWARFLGRVVGGCFLDVGRLCVVHWLGCFLLVVVWVLFDWLLVRDCLAGGEWWRVLFSLGLLVWAFSGGGLLSNGLLAGVFVALVVIGSGRFLGMGVDCWWVAFVCLVRALAVGGFCWRAGTLARDYFLLALGDWLVLVCGGGQLAIVACVIVGRFGRGARGDF